MRENAGQNNSKYGHFLRSAIDKVFQQFLHTFKILHKPLHNTFARET